MLLRFSWIDAMKQMRILMRITRETSLLVLYYSVNKHGRGAGERERLFIITYISRCLRKRHRHRREKIWSTGHCKTVRGSNDNIHAVFLGYNFLGRLASLRRQGRGNGKRSEPRYTGHKNISSTHNRVVLTARFYPHSSPHQTELPRKQQYKSQKGSSVLTSHDRW